MIGFLSDLFWMFLLALPSTENRSCSRTGRVAAEATTVIVVRGMLTILCLFFLKVVLMLAWMTLRIPDGCSHVGFYLRNSMNIMAGQCARCSSCLARPR